MQPYKLVVTSIVDPKRANEARTVAVRRILDHWGYDHRQVVDPLWYGWASKMRHIIRVCQSPEYEEFSHIMFLDARDVVVLGSPVQVMERFFAFNHPWVYSAEPFIWSPGSFMPDDYPPCDTPYRYLNSGASIGRREHMIHWFDKWTQGGRAIPTDLPLGDQDWVAARFLDSYPHAIKLDTDCELFQSMCGSQVDPIAPRVTVTRRTVHNNVTNTDPLIIHFNGGTDITDPERRGLWQHLV